MTSKADKVTNFSRPNTGTLPVGTTAVQVSTSTRELTLGVQILADAGNAGVIYVSSSPNVTAGTNDETDGFPLVAGATLMFPAREENKVYLIATAVLQSISFLSY